jgi:hypothetical protein
MALLDEESVLEDPGRILEVIGGGHPLELVEVLVVLAIADRHDVEPQSALRTELHRAHCLARRDELDPVREMPVWAAVGVAHHHEAGPARASA